MFEVGDCVQFKSPDSIPVYPYLPYSIRIFIEENQNKDFRIIEKKKISSVNYSYRLDCMDSLWVFDFELNISNSTDKIDNEFVEMLF